MESVYEQFFFLKYSGGWSFMEAYNLPLGLREWFVKRLLQQLEAEKDAIENSSKGGGGAQTHSLSAGNQPQMPSGMSNWIGGSE
tara:strand:- start:645 stop:896 length:252 start_codon:yes stop_codon:yes gene_type:complete